MLSWTEIALDECFRQRLSLVGFVILYYDYTLTLGVEVSRFYSPFQLTWGTGIFLLNRYLAIIGHIPVFLDVFHPNPTKAECLVFLAYHQYLVILIQAVVGAIMIMRIHALWDRSILVLGGLLTLAICVIVFGGWAVSTKHTVVEVSLPPAVTGCVNGLTPEQARRLGVAWSGVLVFDAVVFGLTVYKAVKVERTGRRTLVDVLLRDGSMYFAVLGTSTLANVLTFMFGDPLTSGVATIFTNTVSSTCAARLMLNIRNPKVQLAALRTTLDTAVTNIPFVSTLVDLDAPVVWIEEREENCIELTPRNETERVWYAI